MPWPPSVCQELQPGLVEKVVQLYLATPIMSGELAHTLEHEGALAKGLPRNQRLAHEMATHAERRREVVECVQELQPCYLAATRATQLQTVTATNEPIFPFLLGCLQV